MVELAERESVAAHVNHVYNIYRTALLNTKYYAERLKENNRRNTWVEIIMAISAPGAVSAWAVWKTGIGDVVWKILATTAGVLAVLKPILAFHKAVERYSKLWARYTDLAMELGQLVAEIQGKRNWNEEFDKRAAAAANRMRELAGEDDYAPSMERLNDYFDAVNQEVPADTLWVP